MSIVRDWKPKQWPWDPSDYEDEVVWAVRAFYAGKATEGQQNLVWEWMQYITGAGDGYQDLSFRPGIDGSRATDFAEGKRFVGLQVRKMLHHAVTPKAIKR